MCYHVSTPSKKKLKEILPDVNLLDYDARREINGFDHTTLPVLLNSEADRIQGAIWGFLPFFIKAADIRETMNKTLNARCETVFSSPMFKQAARKNRCLVMVDGFFEWQHAKQNGKIEKVKYFIERADQKAFPIGGLWSRYGTGDEAVLTCNLITTPANALMSEIHNSTKRMPFVIPEASWGLWLDEQQPADQVQELMQPLEEGILVAHPVIDPKEGIRENTLF